MAEIRTYTVLSGGESIYEIARKLDMPFQELIAHNSLEEEDLDSLPAGRELHLPFARNVPDQQPLRYELFDQPRKMHVIIQEGIKKFSFAGVDKWEDLQIVGPSYPFNANVEIVGVAHVPIGDETAMYFMDALAWGTDYRITGRPAYTVGFNHSQLAEGFVEQVKKPIPPEREQRMKVLIQSHKDEPAPGLASMATTEIDYRVPDEAEDRYQFVTTYVPYPQGPKMYIANDELWVKDFMAKRSDKQLKKSQDVLIAGTFIVDDTEYGRPHGAAKNFLWYGIPMADLISEEELYNTDIPLHERVGLSHGRLSVSERYLTVPLAKAISQTTRLRTTLGKIKNQKGIK